MVKVENFVRDKDRNMNDISKENPKLHMLYTKWACEHLTLINKMIRRLGDCDNINMLGPQEALMKEKRKLIKNDKAYADANEIIKSIKKVRLTPTKL